MKTIVWTVWTVLYASLSAFAGSSVWQVETDAGPVTYLGGTCHLLRQSDHPLPEAYDQAYRNAAALIFETDIGQVQSIGFQQELLKRALYTDGNTLDKVLSKATYAKLSAAYSRIGVPMAQLNSFKPFMALLTLLGVELQKIGVTSEVGVDLFFYKKATTDGKPVSGLETTATQLDFLATMADGVEDRFILHGLKDIERANQLINELIDTWRQGDENKLYRFFLKDMRNDFPKMYRKLVIDRNNDWMPHIVQLLQTPEKEFILVGVAHLVGPEGIVAQLKKQGYRVSKVQ